MRDTRESGEMLEAAIAAGVTAAGGDALLAGVLPTPAAPLLVRRHGLQMAAVISASHNPYEDNGIKLFAADGFKLDDDTEHEIEAVLEQPPAPPGHIGRVRRLHGALEDYLRALHDRASATSTSAGRRVLLDCANGATYRAAPEIFRRLGAEVEVMADAARRSQHQRRLRLDPSRRADRARPRPAATSWPSPSTATATASWPSTREAVSSTATSSWPLAALHLRGSGRPAGGGVAVTVMTNYGFHTAMAQAGVEVATTAVGDRYVLDELRRRGWALGGEQSGHIIELGFGPSGDGIASALLTVEALAGRDLRDRGAMEKLPQRLVNIRAADRAVAALPRWRPRELGDAIEREQIASTGRGRVLVRASGTEPLIRVMVEAPQPAETDDVCDRLVRGARSQRRPGRVASARAADRRSRGRRQRRHARHVNIAASCRR